MTRDGFHRTSHGRRAVISLVAVVGMLTGACASSTPDKPSSAPPSSPVHATTVGRVHFAGFPPVGAQMSLPASGRILLNISPVSSRASWNVYADGRIIWQRWTRSGDPLVIPNGADLFHTAYIQQRLTPQGAQLLLSRVLATGQAAGLFRHNLRLANKAFEQNQDWAWYQVRNNGHLIDTSVSPPSDWNGQPHRNVTPAQIRALAQINKLLANSTGRLPASAWADRTIRHYVPSHYQLVFDRYSPDPSKLPSPAKEALARYQRLLHHACQVITTDQARALIKAFVEAGVKLEDNHGGTLEFYVPAVGHDHHTYLDFRPYLPALNSC